MQNIFIVGSISKDVFLHLDTKQNHFETDQNQVKWLDLAFDGSSHHYRSRASVYGCASIALEVLTRFGLDAHISGTNAAFIDGIFMPNNATPLYRYIFCADTKISYFAPHDRPPSNWDTPSIIPDWVYIDRSANLSPSLTETIIDYLSKHQNTKLALFLSNRLNPHAAHVDHLIQAADLILAESKVSQKLTNERLNLVTIDDHYIQYKDQRVFWTLGEKQDLTTRMSTYTTIAATMLGAIAIEKNSTDALLLARANVERAKLGSTSNLNTLESAIPDDYYRIEKNNIKDKHMLELERNAIKLVTPGRGILAADESGGSIHKKFESMHIPDDEQHRRDYRNIFFTTPDLEKYVNGVILFDETARQKADNGQDFVAFLAEKGILPGIKVDQGLVNFENSDEKYTKGLDGLPERLAEYYRMGARFAKWRAAFEVTDHSPSPKAIQKNAEILTDYAVACQNAGIVPIVEPELVYDGDYPIEKNIEYTGKILDQLFDSLKAKQVNLPACILKVNMVLAGKRYHTQSTPEEVGRATAEVLREHVPSELAGVVFLSGGQSVEQATANLQAVTNNGPFPWPVTFSFARALQDPALHAWKGNNANADLARHAFQKRLIANANALIRK
ncbi:fructose-bisphosphate aldolase class I [Candidatus Saccharibacteria bacterium]|nr:fructose-bisphosphate aldolase class I [Candidatus Saccharibacteria bacterium]